MYTWVYPGVYPGVYSVYTHVVYSGENDARRAGGQKSYDESSSNGENCHCWCMLHAVWCIWYGAHCIWCKLYGELSLVVYATGRAQASPQQPPKVTAVVVIREQLGGTGAAWAYSGVRERERAQRAFERTGCRYPRMKTHFKVQLHLRGLEVLFLEIIPEY